MKHFIFLRRLLPNCSWGGCEKRLIDYFMNVNYTKIKITLITTEDIFSQKIQDMGLPIQVMKFPFVFSKSFFARFVAMFKLLKTLNPYSVIYDKGDFFDFSLPDFLAGFIITKGNIFSIETSGSPVPPEKSSKKHFNLMPGLGLWWYKKMFFNSVSGYFFRQILAVSDEVKHRLSEWYHYPERKIVTVYHGVDLNKFTPDMDARKNMRLDYRIFSDDTVIISTARLSDEKCLHRLINAFDLACKSPKNTWLFFVGDGPLKNDLERLANEKILKNKIKFLGFKEDISSFLKMSDIFVLPSDIEGLSIAMLEAMSTALIAVVTKTPGPSEIIKDGINGFLVERSEKGVYEGLRKALSLTQDEREQIKSNARRTIQERFTIEDKIRKALKTLGIDEKNKFPY